MEGRRALGIPLARLVPWLVLALGLGATIALYGFMLRAVRRTNDNFFRRDVERLTVQMDAALGEQVTVLRATAGLIAGSHRVDRPEFAAFYADLSQSPAGRLPGAIGLTLSRPWSRRSELETTARDRGVSDFRFRPPEPRDEAHAIILLEPYTGTNVGMAGFDMHSESTRRAAMDAARDAGQPVLSQPVTLVQDRSAPEPSFLLYLPIYDAGLPRESPTVADRRAHHLGFVYSALRASRLFGSLAPTLEERKIGVRIWSVGPGRDDLVYEHRFPRSSPYEKHTAITFQEARSGLRADFVGLPDYGTPAQVRQYVLPAGFALSVLLFALATVLRRSHEAAERREMEQTLLAETGRLAARESDDDAVLAQIAAQLAHSLDAVCRIDLIEPDGALRTVNTRTERRETLAQLERHYPRQDHDPLYKEAVATGQTQNSDAYPAVGEGHRARIEAMGVGPVLVVPLWVGDHALGTITLVRPVGRPRFTQDSAALVETIAGRLALAIENARLYHNLERRVAERTRDLEASNHELESFCYSVSHDLRTPLRSLDGFSRALEEDYGDRLDEQGLDFVERIRAATKRMDELITALLTLSRLTRREIVPTRVDVTEMVRDQLHDLDPQGKVRAEIQDGLTAQADPRMLAVVLDNLLSNAIKFSSRSESPCVEVGRTPEGELFVRDNGAGFDMAYAAKLFQPFERLHSVREFPGHGIGLATVERIVRRHGGSVRAEGEPGKGATFFLRFPE